MSNDRDEEMQLRPQHPIDVSSLIDVPALRLYGGADSLIPNDTVIQMEQALQAAKSPSKIVLYPDMPHGFHADYRPTYRQDVAQDAWARLQAWFKQHGVH